MVGVTIPQRYERGRLVSIHRLVARYHRRLEFVALLTERGSLAMKLHFSLGLIVLVAVIYIVGARYPVLAQKVGLA